MEDIVSALPVRVVASIMRAWQKTLWKSATKIISQPDGLDACDFHEHESEEEKQFSRQIDSHLPQRTLMVKRHIDCQKKK